MSTERLGGPRVEVGDLLLATLERICPVDTSAAGRDEHGRDWWPLSGHWARHAMVAAAPTAVVLPTTAAEVGAVLAACHEARVPVTPTAGRSGVCGGSVAVFGGVALDLCGLYGEPSVDDTSLLVDVGAGTRGDNFEADLRSGHGLTCGHWPQSMAISTVGGWVACRSAGQYSTRYGKIEDMVAGLEVALADGRVIRTGGRAPRAAMGPDLTQVFVGSEGTLGVVTEARLRVHPVPPAERRAAFCFPSFAAGLEACRRILRRGATPAVLRLYDALESQRSFDVDNASVLIVLDEAEPRLADAVLHIVGEECAAAGAEPESVDLVERWLAARNDVSELAGLIERGVVVDTCEVAARWSHLPGVHAAGMAALEARPGTVWASAHLSHGYGDGACVYFTFAGLPQDPQSAEQWYVEAWDALAAAVMAEGAALSHHHGIGLTRGRFLAGALGPAFEVLVALKGSLDPHGILNPGKLGLPSPWGAPAWP